MKYDIKVCKKEDRDYPRLFEGIGGMPERFYCAGDISRLNAMPGVAIVVSRKCTDEALALARDAGRIAAEEGLSIINGLAMGCDTEALLGALERDGKCIVVLPGGINRLYPKCNEGLLQEIIDGDTGEGCLYGCYQGLDGESGAGIEVRVCESVLVMAVATG